MTFPSQARRDALWPLLDMIWKAHLRQRIRWAYWL